MNPDEREKEGEGVKNSEGGTAEIRLQEWSDAAAAAADSTPRWQDATS